MLKGERSSRDFKVFRVQCEHKMRRIRWDSLNLPESDLPQVVEIIDSNATALYLFSGTLSGKKHVEHLSNPTRSALIFPRVEFFIRLLVYGTIHHLLFIWSIIAIS